MGNERPPMVGAKNANRIGGNSNLIRSSCPSSAYSAYSVQRPRPMARRVCHGCSITKWHGVMLKNVCSPVHVKANVHVRVLPVRFSHAKIIRQIVAVVVGYAVGVRQVVRAGGGMAVVG